MEEAYLVQLADKNSSFRCRSEETVLAAMERAGAVGIPVGCRCAGCGVCKVQILVGEVALTKMSRAHVSRDEESRGIVLACCAKPKSDLVLWSAGAGEFE